ncbi:putative Transposase (IS4 family) [Legionella geestiana]|uniref:Putative Transposase (IS4 family) n=1 Tax=Legionella geestiana TaxID=45065 RepID=A0A0W0U7T0_9GAMM|nr:putative Transposase (IS4 family) [Legionella geestiana]STX53415.1 putative transposase [Legionella geestiana]
MECINELQDSLNAYFKWNKARINCFMYMLLGLLTTRTVNLAKTGLRDAGRRQAVIKIPKNTEIFRSLRT